MAQVSTFLNFSRNTEDAFAFYKTVFGTDYLNEGIVRIQDAQPGDENLVAHVALPITGGHVLHGADAPDSMGMHVTFGNNVYIMLELDNRAEADKLFEALSAKGKIVTPLQEQPWGPYYGACTDKFGVQWILNCEA